MPFDEKPLGLAALQVQRSGHASVHLQRRREDRADPQLAHTLERSEPQVVARVVDEQRLLVGQYVREDRAADGLLGAGRRLPARPAADDLEVQLFAALQDQEAAVAAKAFQGPLHHGVEQFVVVLESE
jgi:hypothetical protein